MTSRFTTCVNAVFAKEGGLANRDLKDDPGGATNYGITIATLAAFRGRKQTVADVKRLTRTEARSIYKAMYWDVIDGDALGAGVDLTVMDFGVHSGPSRAVRFLQKAIGAKPDGVVGPVTLRLLRAAPAATVIDRVNDYRVAFVKRLKNFAANPGWLPRIAMIGQKALAMVGAVPTADAGGDQFEPNPRRSNLPGKRPAQTSAHTRAIGEAHRHLIPSKFRHAGVYVLFVRGYYSRSFGKAGNDRGVWDDAAFLVTPDRVTPFNANSDPSTFRRRIATLKALQCVLYVKGKHGISRGGGYDAFRQASDVTVIRDQIGEDTDSPSRRFWINLHSGSASGGTSSLGCLTIVESQWPEFRSLAYAALTKANQSRLPVVLIEYASGAEPVPNPSDQVLATPNPVTTVPSTPSSAPRKDTTMNEDTKPWYASKGVIGSLGAILAPIAGIAGYSVSGEDIQQAVALGTALATSVSGLLALIGRITATSRVS